MGATDLFVLRRVDRDRFAHLGGLGRGVGWAGIVEVEVGHQPHLTAAIATGRPHLVGQDPEGAPAHVFGPYWAVGAVVVPVGADVLVVLGHPTTPLRAEGIADAAACAAHAEALVDEISPAKRLADELEVVHAVQAVMRPTATRVEEVAQHVVDVAAAALSCEIAVLLLDHGDVVAVHDRGVARTPDLPLRHVLRGVAADPAALPTCAQLAVDRPLPAPLSPADGVVAWYALRIDRDEAQGMLLVCHLEERARGFTTLCQQLGVRLVDAAGAVLATAVVRDVLERTVEAARRDASIDALTGLANRRSFDAAIDVAERRRQDGGHAGVVVVDLDGLKRANDVHGHDVGDELIRAAAATLRVAVAGRGRVARVGGDEFAVLVPDAADLDRVTSDIAAEIAAAAPIRGLVLAASIGAAASCGEVDVRAAMRRADSAMYARKLARDDVGQRPPAASPV